MKNLYNTIILASFPLGGCVNEVVDSREHYQGYRYDVQFLQCHTFAIKHSVNGEVVCWIIITVFMCTHSKNFNVVSMLSFGWYEVATWYNLKSTLKQRFVFQCWNLQRQTTSKQRCVF